MQYGSQKSECHGSYKRHRPEQTPLYRIVYHWYEHLEREWTEEFQGNYGAYRSEVRESFEKYLSCGVLAHGCARARCERCNHSILIAFSCKVRNICPSCAAKRAELFGMHLSENILLHKPHRHVVFSLPKRLRCYYRYNRKLLGELFKAAWQAWCEMTGVGQGSRAGAVMGVHTFGDLLHWHPHS